MYNYTYKKSLYKYQGNFNRNHVLCLKIRFVPSEGQYESENEVETTYKILIPADVKNYQLPRYRPIPEPLQLPFRPMFDSRLSLTPIRGQLGFPFYPIPQVSRL